MNINLHQLALRAFCATFPHYRPKKCHLNVRQILDQMWNSVSGGGDVRALMLTAPESLYFSGLRTLWQHSHKTDVGPDWTFHVCLDVQGHIFDPVTHTKSTFLTH